MCKNKWISYLKLIRKKKKKYPQTKLKRKIISTRKEIIYKNQEYFKLKSLVKKSKKKKKEKLKSV